MVAGMLIEGGTRDVIRSNNRIEATETEKIKSIGFELFQGFVPYSFAAVFRRDIHAYCRAAVARVKIEEIDATNG